MVKEIRVTDLGLTPEEMIDLELTDTAGSQGLEQMLADLDVVNKVKEDNRLVKKRDGSSTEYMSRSEKDRQYKKLKYAEAKLTRRPPAASKRIEGYHKSKKATTTTRKKFTG